MKRSQIPLARGARWGVLRSAIPGPAATEEKRIPYLLSRSWRRYLGPLPHGVASRNCWVVHSSEGDWVTATCTIRRVLSSITVALPPYEIKLKTHGENLNFVLNAIRNHRIIY